MYCFEMYNFYISCLFGNILPYISYCINVVIIYCKYITCTLFLLQLISAFVKPAIFLFQCNTQKDVAFFLWDFYRLDALLIVCPNMSDSYNVKLNNA